MERRKANFKIKMLIQGPDFWLRFGIHNSLVLTVETNRKVLDMLRRNAVWAGRFDSSWIHFAVKRNYN